MFEPAGQSTPPYQVQNRVSLSVSEFGEPVVACISTVSTSIQMRIPLSPRFVEFHTLLLCSPAGIQSLLQTDDTIV
jgi:hypothetical protein